MDPGLSSVHTKVKLWTQGMLFEGGGGKTVCELASTPSVLELSGHDSLAMRRQVIGSPSHRSETKRPDRPEDTGLPDIWVGTSSRYLPGVGTLVVTGPTRTESGLRQPIAESTFESSFSGRVTFTWSNWVQRLSFVDVTSDQ